MKDKSVFARFTGEGGYDKEREEAHKIFQVGAYYEIVGGNIGRFHSTYIIKEIKGSWNSVFFDVDINSLAHLLENDYIGESYGNYKE